ncbi:MAG: DNA primase [Flavobacterium sp.]|nr:DNA primase [Flavobacterium sp.]
MKRIIVDYSKLTNEILNLLVERFPDGYDDSNIIRFRNAQNELIEAVEVRTHDTIYLVKVSTKLASRLEKFEDEDLEDIVVPIDAIKAIGIDEEEDSNDEEEEETDLSKDPEGSIEDDDDDDFEEDEPIEEDEDE